MMLDNKIIKEKFVDHIHLLHAQPFQVEELLLKVQSEMDFELLQIKSQKVLLNKAEHLVRDWHSILV